MAKPSRKPIVPVEYIWDSVVLITSLYEDSTVKAKPLSNQLFGDGSPIQSHFTVLCDSVVINAKPMGTLFAVPTFLVDEDTSVTEYEAEPYQPLPIASQIASDTYELYDNVDLSVVKILIAYCENNGLALINAPELPKEKVKVPRKPLTQLEKLQRDPVYAIPTIDTDGFHVEHDQWWDIVANLHFGENMLLTGPTGTGKTDIISILAKRTGRVLYTKDMGTMYDPQTAMLGTHRLVKGESQFDYAAYAMQIQQPNVIMLLDELSRATASANNLLLPQLDHRRMLPIEIADSQHQREVKVHENLSFFATANIGGEYTGTMEMDEALLNRFNVVEMQYMSESIEQLVLIKRTGIDKSDAEKISKFATELRTAAANEELSKGVSHRQTLSVATKVHRGFTLEKSLLSIVAPKYIGSERQSVISIIQKY